MFEFNYDTFSNEVADLIGRFRELPNHIAKKHIRAALRKVAKGAIPAVRKNTPKRGKRVVFGGGRGGREYTATKIKGGSLRRAVTTDGGLIKGGGPATGWAAVGYSRSQRDPYNDVSQSRKAIWLEEGTLHAFARGMVAMTVRQIGKPSAEIMARELARSLEKAAAELASKKNPGMSRRGLAAGIPPR